MDVEAHVFLPAHPAAQMFPDLFNLTSRWSPLLSVLTPIELISHGGSVHLWQQTLDATHIVLTQKTQSPLQVCITGCPAGTESGPAYHITDSMLN